jgi:hypothetical protein
MFPVPAGLEVRTGVGQNPLPAVRAGIGPIKHLRVCSGAFHYQGCLESPSPLHRLRDGRRYGQFASSSHFLKTGLPESMGAEGIRSDLMGYRQCGS